MMKATEDIVHMPLDFLPLKTYTNIHEGNALRMDWEEVVPKAELNYIMGNPPFIGAMMMIPKQRADLTLAFSECKKVGEADYVTGWYAKAAHFIKSTNITCAFVSTNSICQGQAVASVWKPLTNLGVKINFAYRTFIWDSEANLKAHVHCIIIGFSFSINTKEKILFDESGQRKFVSNINPYLIDAKTIFVDSRSKPICNIPEIRFGSMPRDGGGLILSTEEKTELINKEPLAAKWVKKYLGALEFLNGKERWCLWLLGADPQEILKCPSVVKRIEYVKQVRLESKAAGTRKFAETPHLFCQIAQPKFGNYIAVPKTSSEKRKYIPMDFLDSDIIASDLLFLIPNAEMYHFGILESNVHMAWMRLVAGRLKSDYRYAKDIVYNNFPWPTPSEAQKVKIIQTAQAILETRKKYPNSTLANMYGDKMYLYTDLLEAHRANDRAVMEAYGFYGKHMTEAQCVAELMKLYQKLVEGK